MLVQDNKQMSDSTTQSRLDLISAVSTALKKLYLVDGSRVCISDENTLANTFKILGRIGSGSANGEAFKMCYPMRCERSKSGKQRCECDKDPHMLALKKIPLEETMMKYFNNPFSPVALSNSLFAELLCMQLCKYLVDHGVTPNLPMYANYFICDDCTYENEKLQELHGEPCLILVNELASEGDIKKWSEEPRSTAEWLNAYFQIFVGLYALQKYFDLTHHDLHWGNVLVHKVPRGGYTRYRIDGRTYDMPNLGYLFVLWDFGYARIPGKMEIKDLQWMYEKKSQNPRLLVDYNRISSINLWRSTDDHVMFSLPEAVNDFLEAINDMFERGGTLNEVIQIYKTLYPTGDDHHLTDIFSLDKPIYLPPHLKHFQTDKSLKSREPTAAEIIANRALKKFMRNSAVPVRKRITGYLSGVMQTPEFEERSVLTAANFPPPEVTDIIDPEEAIVVEPHFLELLDGILQDVTVTPKFVQQILVKLTQIHMEDPRAQDITRAEWARFIQWLGIIGATKSDIRKLIRPVKDYFRRGRFFNSTEYEK